MYLCTYLLQARLADADRAALEHARQCAVLQQELARVQQQQQQQQPLQRASVGIDAGLLRLTGGESSEARAVALLQELRHQLHEKVCFAGQHRLTGAAL